MSTELVPFSNGVHNVRALEIDGDPWFVASDLAGQLGYRDAANLTRGLEDDERGTQIVSTPSGPQEMTVISEPGLYRVMATLRRPEVKPFQRWLYHDVLPSIRKYGVYSVAVPAPLAVRQDKSEALALLQYKTRTERKEARELEAKGLYRNPLTGEILPLPGVVPEAELEDKMDGIIQGRWRKAKKSENNAFQTEEEFKSHAAWNNAIGER